MGEGAMAKFLPLPQAVAENLKDGDSVAFEGFTHLIPTAAAHEAIRQGFRDLVLIRMTPDLIYDQMIGMGMARKIVFSYIGNPGVGLLRRARDAVENGWPRAVSSRSTAMCRMANAYVGWRGAQAPFRRSFRRLSRGRRPAGGCKRPEHQTVTCRLHRRGDGRPLPALRARTGPSSDAQLGRPAVVHRCGGSIVAVPEGRLCFARGGGIGGGHARRGGVRFRTSSTTHTSPCCRAGPLAADTWCPGGSHPSYTLG